MKRLTDYEAAWVLGGAERVALTVFVAMTVSGQLDVAYKRQRVREGEVPLSAADDSSVRIETAALELLPSSGLTVGEFLTQLATAPVLETLDEALATKGVRRPAVLPRFSPLHRELREQPATGVRRVAVLGVEGIDDERLRDIFEHPLPGVPRVAEVPPFRDTYDGMNEPSRYAWYGG